MRVRLLSGDLDVEGDTPEEIQVEVATRMGVVPRHVHLVEFEGSYLCTISLPSPPEWVDVERLLEQPQFSSNPRAIPLLAQYPHRINYYYLSANPHPTAIEWLVESGRIDWFRLSSNPTALDLLATAGDQVVVEQLCRNPNPDAMWLILPYTALPSFRWNELALNPNAIDVLDQYLQVHPDRADWTSVVASDVGTICMRRLGTNVNAAPIFARLGRTVLELFGNPNALDLVSSDPRIAEGDEQVWTLLCSNTAALPIIERYPQHIQWRALSTNTNAIEILTANFHRVDTRALSTNPNALALLERSFGEPWTKEPWPRYRNAPDHRSLSALRSPDLMPFLERHPLYIYWPELAANPFVFE